MSALILDAGALAAFDRGDRAMIVRHRVAANAGLDLRTTGILVAGVWRDPGGRQAQLARLLTAVDVRPVDLPLARRVGELVGRAATSDPVDATLVCSAATGDRILTSDNSDISRLVVASGRSIGVIAC